MCGDDIGDALGDGPGATNRIVPAAQVAAHDERMNRKRALRRGQAVISPLRGEHRSELRVTHMRVEIRRRRGERERPSRAAGDPNERSQRPGDSLGDNLRAGPAGRGVEVSEVGLDRVTLLRVARDERLAIARFVVRHVEGEVRVHELLERRGHLLPPHTAPGHEVEQLSAHLAGSHSAHVMQPDIPRAMAGPRETVREPAEPEMALQQQHALSLELSHEARDSQPTHTGADDDEVKVPVVRSHASLSSQLRVAVVFSRP